MTVFNKELRTCVGVLTADCHNNGTEIHEPGLPKDCIENAECKNKTEGPGRQTCQCKSGYNAVGQECLPNGTGRFDERRVAWPWGVPRNLGTGQRG